MKQKKMIHHTKRQIWTRRIQKKRLIQKISDTEDESLILQKSINRNYPSFIKHKKKQNRNIMKFQLNMQRTKKRKCINT